MKKERVIKEEREENGVKKGNGKKTGGKVTEREQGKRNAEEEG